MCHRFPIPFRTAISKIEGLKALVNPVFSHNQRMLLIFGTFQLATIIFAVFISILKPRCWQIGRAIESIPIARNAGVHAMLCHNGPVMPVDLWWGKIIIFFLDWCRPIVNLTIYIGIGTLSKYRWHQKEFRIIIHHYSCFFDDENVIQSTKFGTYPEFIYPFYFILEAETRKYFVFCTPPYSQTNFRWKPHFWVEA